MSVSVIVASIVITIMIQDEQTLALCPNSEHILLFGWSSTVDICTFTLII